MHYLLQTSWSAHQKIKNGSNTRKRAKTLTRLTIWGDPPRQRKLLHMKQEFLFWSTNKNLQNLKQNELKARARSNLACQLSLCTLAVGPVYEMKPSWSDYKFSANRCDYKFRSVFSFKWSHAGIKVRGRPQVVKRPVMWCYHQFWQTVITVLDSSPGTSPLLGAGTPLL